MWKWLASILIGMAILGVACGEAAAPTATPVTPTTRATQPPAAPAATPVPAAALIPTPAPEPTRVPPAVVVKRGGVLNLRLGDPPQHFDYFQMGVGWMYQITAPVYNGLVGFDPLDSTGSPDRIQPELADRWEFRDGGATAVFHLRGGVKFHDGAPLTAEDVLFTFGLILNPPQGYPSPRKGILFDVKDVVDEGNGNVALKLNAPSASFLERMAGGWFQIAPKHVWEREGNLKSAMVGTGPFRFVEFTPQNMVVEERNPDYFLQGRPYLDGVRHIPVVEAGTAMAALYAKIIDASDTSAEDWTRDVLAIISKERPEILIQRQSASTWWFLGLNTKFEPWTNQRVRQAVQMSIDRQEILDAIGQLGTVGGSFVPGTAFASPMDLLEETDYYGPIEARRAKARQILKEEGIEEGYKITLWSKSGGYQADAGELTAKQIEENLPFKVTHQVLPSAEFNPRESASEFPAWVEAMGAPGVDPDIITGYYHASTAGRNYWKSQDPRIDELFKLQATILDFDQRVKAVRELDKAIMEDAAHGTMWWFDRGYPQWPYVKNLVRQPSPFGRAERLEQVWLDK